MTWDHHINHVQKQINRNLYLLKQIRTYLPLDARKLFYNSYILPYFRHCCTVWGNCSKTILDELLKLQKRAVGLILDVQNIFSPSHGMFTDLEWMPLPKRIAYHHSVQVFKCLKGQCPSNLENLFQFNHDVHGHNTRSAQNDKLFIPQYHYKSFSYVGDTSIIRSSEWHPSTHPPYQDCFYL